MDALLKTILAPEQADEVSKIFDWHYFDLELLLRHKTYGDKGYTRLEESLIGMGIECPIVRAKIIQASGVTK